MKYFGTDGIRGIYGQGLSDQLAYRVGLAASQLMGNECFLGMDTRESSEALVAAVASGLVEGGTNVKLVGIVPTPAISYLSAKYHTGGIMVSASHNPPEYNGLKFFTADGYKPTPFFENSIEEYVMSPPVRIGGGKMIEYKEGRREYIDWLVGLSGDLSGREITLDCAFGAATTVAEEVFGRCGARTRVFAAEKDGSRINCGVGALHPRFIEEKTERGIGFAFDGDADRLVVTDGKILDGDSALFNLALRLKAHGVAGTIMSNAALERELSVRGVEFVRTAVGDKNISEVMKKRGFTLGGEQSGHYIISPAVSGDALLAALTLSKSESFIRLQLVPQKEASIESSPKILYHERFVKVKSECSELLGTHGRLIVRMSGTEPKIRLMAEGEDEILLNQIIDNLSEVIISLNKEAL